MTRPEYDYPTRYISTWAEKIVKLANKKSSAVDLPQEKANKKLVESMLKKHDPSLVFFNGHESAKNSFKKNIRELLTSTSSPHSVSVPYLLWDLQALTFVGDGAAKYS